MLTEKIQSAYKILRLAEKEAQAKGEAVEIAYSGGKDSDVLLQLAKESGIKYRAIYKNTTIDPKGTIEHIRAMGAEIIQPKQSFFKLIERRGYPSFLRRFCCDELKEYKILSVACVGVRREESQKRAKMYDSFEKCRMYKRGERVRQYYPIIDWTLEDLREFINDRKLQLAKPYYNEHGELDLSRRLGCMGCPLPANRSVQDFKDNPALTRAWLKAGAVWFSRRTYQSGRRFNSALELFVCLLCYRNYDDFRNDFYNKDGSTKRDVRRWFERFIGYKIPIDWTKPPRKNKHTPK